VPADAECGGGEGRLVARLRFLCYIRRHRRLQQQASINATPHSPIHTQPTHSAHSMAEVLDGGPAGANNAPPPVVRVADPLGQEVSA
jgi:hypothetical protein